jgi:hypothetical protein
VLTPQEALQLYDTVCTEIAAFRIHTSGPAGYQANLLQGLHLEERFADTVFMTQAQARDWATDILKRLDQVPELLARVAAKLQEPARARECQLSAAIDTMNHSCIPGEVYSTEEAAFAVTANMLLTLDAQDKLPVIAFLLDRKGCEKLALAVAQHLDGVMQGNTGLNFDARQAMRADIENKLADTRKHFEEAQTKKSSQQGNVDSSGDALLDEIASNEQQLRGTPLVDPKYSFAGVSLKLSWIGSATMQVYCA